MNIIQETIKPNSYSQNFNEDSDTIKGEQGAIKESN